MRSAAAVCLAALSTLIAACDSAPPSWDRLLAERIASHFPGCTVAAPGAGRLRLDCPGQAAQPIEVAPIAQFCQRGPRDCEYGVDQLLLSLKGPAQ